MKSSRKIISVVLCGCLLLALLPSLLATVADDLEESMLGELSAMYESCGDPGAIATVSGDPGGKSYGLYMFTSKSGTPKAFFEWCQASSNAYYRGIGNTLSYYYYYGTPGYGPLFDQAWRNLAADNPVGFGRAQRDFVRNTYYDQYVNRIAQKVPGFDISNYSIALRNVLWSRTIQHGVSGATNVFTRAMDTLGGFTNQPERELIDAIYAESGRLTVGDYPKMSGPTARRLGVEGMSMYYYTGCSGEIQLGVYIRLRINEPANAQAMLAEYGYGDAPVGEGSYILCPSGNDNLAIGIGSSGLTLNTRSDGDDQQFRLVYYASGYYTVTNASNDLRLTASASGVSLSAPTASDSQFWSLVPFNSGFLLKNRATDKCLSASSFSAGGQITTAGENAQWQLAPGDANWSLDGASYPSYASGLRVGNSTFPFRGTLRSTYNITFVRAEVLNASGSVCFYAEDTPGAPYYDLSKMDNAMTFGRLDAGLYTMHITATDSSDSQFDLAEPFIVSDGDYMVTFDPAGGTCDVAARTFEAGQVLGELPTPVWPGHVFLGWYDENGTLYTAASITPAHNLLLIARYAEAYTYTFYDYDGATVLSSGSLLEGEAIPAPADPIRPSDDLNYYVFSGWEGYEPGMTMGKENVSFTAVYDAFPRNDITELVVTGPYTLADGYLRVIPVGTTAEDILNALEPHEYIAVHQNGKPVTGVVGTGMTVDFTVDGKLIQSAVIVVTGDVNGDGAVTLTDMVQIRAHLLGRSTLKDAYAQAADLNGDKDLTLTDFVQSLSAVLGRSQIKPN